MAIYLASKGYNKIVAIDNDDRSLQIAKKNIEKYGFIKNIELIHPDSRFTLTSTEKFSLIITNPGGIIIGNNKGNALMTKISTRIDEMMDKGRIVFAQPRLANIELVKSQFSSKGFEIKVIATHAFKLVNPTDVESEVEFNQSLIDDHFFTLVDGHPALIYEMIEASKY